MLEDISQNAYKLIFIVFQVHIQLIHERCFILQFLLLKLQACQIRKYCIYDSRPAVICWLFVFLFFFLLGNFHLMSEFWHNFLFISEFILVIFILTSTILNHDFQFQIPNLAIFLGILTELANLVLVLHQKFRSITAKKKFYSMF